MKPILTIFFALQFLNISPAQKYFEWYKYGIGFSAPETFKLEHFTDNEDGMEIWGFDSSKIAIGIEAVPLEEESQEFIASAEYGANEFAKDMGITTIIKGEEFLNPYKSFYVIGIDNDIDESEYPIIVAVLIDVKRGVAFEITIDCYDKNLMPGIELIKSFRYAPVK